MICCLCFLLLNDLPLFFLALCLAMSPQTHWDGNCSLKFHSFLMPPLLPLKKKILINELTKQICSGKGIVTQIYCIFSLHRSSSCSIFSSFLVVKSTYDGPQLSRNINTGTKLNPPSILTTGSWSVVAGCSQRARSSQSTALITNKLKSFAKLCLFNYLYIGLDLAAFWN